MNSKTVECKISIVLKFFDPTLKGWLEVKYVNADTYFKLSNESNFVKTGISRFIKL